MTRDDKIKVWTYRNGYTMLDNHSSFTLFKNFFLNNKDYLPLAIQKIFIGKTPDLTIRGTIEPLDDEFDVNDYKILDNLSIPQNRVLADIKDLSKYLEDK